MVPVVFAAVLVVAAPDPGPAYSPPVEAEVVDPFRPPATRYAPGNRGIDYATEPGTPVVAAGPGVVGFAGPVAGSLHVTVLHPDGIRTSYSFLRSISVRRGDRVARGRELGRAGPSLHFGARRGEEYLDPRRLLGGVRRARLVPDDDRRPGSPAHERGLVDGLVRSLPPRPREAAAPHRMPSTPPSELRPAKTGPDHGPCTPAAEAPSRPGGRRIAVLVGGYGSTSASAAVDAVDLPSLGYARADVHRFSYNGGTVADRPYDARASGGDLRTAGDRLAALLRQLAEGAPGVPVDVVAHSQGGLVARWALSGPDAPKAVEALVTLGTPHQGADLAAAAVAAHGDPRLRRVALALRQAGVTGVDGGERAVGQLAPGSSFLRELGRRPRPRGLRVASVAARDDVVVAPSRSRLRDAHNVVVTVEGLHDHALLPGSPEARREVALAVAGEPPTCRSPADAAADLLADEAVRASHRLLRRGLAVAPASSPVPVP